MILNRFLVQKGVGNGILNTTILIVEKTIYKNRQIVRAPHINKIKYHIYTQMGYDEYYAEIDKKKLSNFFGNGEIFV